MDDNTEMDYEMQNSQEPSRQLPPLNDQPQTYVPSGCPYAYSSSYFQPVPPSTSRLQAGFPGTMSSYFQLQQSQYQHQGQAPGYLQQSQPQQQLQVPSETQYIQQYGFQRPFLPHPALYVPAQYMHMQQPVQQSGLPSQQQTRQRQGRPVVEPLVSPPITPSTLPPPPAAQQTPTSQQAVSSNPSNGGSGCNSNSPHETTMTGTSPPTAPSSANTRRGGQQEGTQQAWPQSQLSPLSPSWQPPPASQQLLPSLARPSLPGLPSWAAASNLPYWTNGYGQQPVPGYPGASDEAISRWLANDSQSQQSSRAPAQAASSNNTSQSVQQPTAVPAEATTSSTTRGHGPPPSELAAAVTSPSRNTQPRVPPSETAATSPTRTPSSANTLHAFAIRHAAPRATAPGSQQPARSSGDRRLNWQLPRRSQNTDNDNIGYYLSSGDDSDDDGSDTRTRGYFRRVRPNAFPMNMTSEQILRGAITNRRVASKLAISALESLAIESLGDDERMCTICYNDFGVESPEGISEMPLRLPNCKHVFGDHCIKKWLSDNDSCPYCRDKLQSEIRPYMSQRALETHIRNSRERGLHRGHARLSASARDARTSTSNRSSHSNPSSTQASSSSAEGSSNGNGPSSATQHRGTVLGERRAAPSTDSTDDNQRRVRPRHADSRYSRSLADYASRESLSSRTFPPNQDRSDPSNVQPHNRRPAPRVGAGRPTTNRESIFDAATGLRFNGFDAALFNQLMGDDIQPTQSVSSTQPPLTPSQRENIMQRYNVQNALMMAEMAAAEAVEAAEAAAAATTATTSAFTSTPLYSPTLAPMMPTQNSYSAQITGRMSANRSSSSSD